MKTKIIYYFKYAEYKFMPTEIMITIQNRSIKIGSCLRKLRMDKGYKQEYMAEILEVSQKTYSNIENDKSSISIDTLKRIAEEYKIDLLELLSSDTMSVQHTNSNEKSTFQSGTIINQLSIELMNQIKGRVEDLKHIITEKDKRIEFLENRK
jgi:transcriptional regulator with XRE-family HTH domain